MNINELYCIDNVEGMKQLPDNFVDLTVTSPPYDNLRKYNGFTWDFEGVVNQLFRVTKVGGVVVWVVNDQTKYGTESGTSFKQALFFKEVGFNLHDTMIWLKNTFPQNNKRYEPYFEYMFVFSKGSPRTFNPIKQPYSESTINRIKSGDAFSYSQRQGKIGETSKKGSKRVIKVEGTKLKNVWNIPPDIKVNKNEKYLLKHPARFPEELAEKHILSWSNEGDLVLDPFVGSGTTAKMAKKNGRNYLGFDCSQEYVDIANQRLLNE